MMRVMGIFLRNLSLYDFQTAIDRRLNKCNLKEPDVLCEDGQINALSFTTFPEISFACHDPNSQVVKLFRLFEIPKFSNATLRRF